MSNRSVASAVLAAAGALFLASWFVRSDDSDSSLENDSRQNDDAAPSRAPNPLTTRRQQNPLDGGNNREVPPASIGSESLTHDDPREPSLAEDRRNSSRIRQVLSTRLAAEATTSASRRFAYDLQTTVEEHVYALAAVALAGDEPRLEDVRCGTTLCRVDLRVRPEHRDLLLHSLSETPPFRQELTALYNESDSHPDTFTIFIAVPDNTIDVGAIE